MKKSNTKSNLFEVKKGADGFGLFTKIPLKKNEFVIEYKGIILPTKEANLLKTRYLFEINNRWTIDGSDRNNLARYINHACRPNCEAEVDGKKIYIRASKNILLGEELTYDYGKEYCDEFIKPKGCRCTTCVTKKTIKK